jgi:hypothetical protein
MTGSSSSACARGARRILSSGVKSGGRVIMAERWVRVARRAQSWTWWRVEVRSGVGALPGNAGSAAGAAASRAWIAPAHSPGIRSGARGEASSCGASPRSDRPGASNIKPGAGQFKRGVGQGDAGWIPMWSLGLPWLRRHGHVGLSCQGRSSTENGDPLALREGDAARRGADW